MSSFNRRILIVDDNRAIHADFRKILCPEKRVLDAEEAELFGDSAIPESQPQFELDFACQGQEALQQVIRACEEGRPYATAFVDVRMPPGWDGIETTVQIWQKDPRLQIIICTAYSDYSWQQLAAKLANPDKLVILKKPFDVVEVLQLANAFAAKWHLQQEVEERTRRLQESELRFRLLAEALPGMVWTARPDGETDYVNERLSEYSGRPREENKNSGWKTIVHPDDLPSCVERWAESIRTGNRYETEYRLKRASDGMYRWHLVRARPMRDPQGNLLCWVGTSVDIHNQKEAESALRNVQASLENRVAERTEELQTKTALLEAILNSSPNGIIVVDEHGKKTVQNQLVADLLKIPREIVDDPDDKKQVQFVMSQMKHPERFLERVNSLFSHPEEIGFDEIELVDGTILDRYSSPVLGHDGRHYGRIWTFRDITERKRAEQALAYERELLRSLNDNVPDAIARIDREHRFVYVNRVLESVLGLPASRLIGRTHAELDLPAHKEWNEAVQRVFLNGRTETFEFQAESPGGRTFCEARLVPEFAEDGRAQYVLAVTRDITIQERAEKNRKLMEVQLQQAQKLESIGQLAAGIAHEINTPTQYVGDNTRFLMESFEAVTKVLHGYQELFEAARQKPITPEQATRMEELVASCDLAYLFEQIPAAIRETLEGVERVTRIVKAMKEFSHPGSKDKSLTDLNKAIETTVTVARNEWKYVADMKLDFDSSLPAVPCFSGEFNQVILNLVVNAAHTIGDVVRLHPGTKGAIAVSTRNLGKEVEIRVSDTGTGIPEAIRSKVFDPFFTTKGVGKGTGQGLAIVYGTVVRKHGGTVTFDTEVGKGSTFIVRLPVSPAPASENVHPTTSTSAAPAATPTA